MWSSAELDEISFRSKTVGERVVWIRYLAIARRGSSKIWSQLPYRITEGGQGGGGPISLEELKSAILLEDGNSRICEGSVCHTDGARTYKQLGAVDSPLLDREVFHVDFSDFHLAYTAVKHKPPTPESRVHKDISSQGVDWLCLGYGRETRWDTKVGWLFCQLPTRSWPPAI